MKFSPYDSFCGLILRGSSEQGIKQGRGGENKPYLLALNVNISKKKVYVDTSKPKVTIND